MGVIAYCLLWVMQDLYHQPYAVDCTVVDGAVLESAIL